MSASLHSVFTHTYQYPAEEVYDGSRTLIGTQYQIVGAEGPDKAFVPVDGKRAWTSLQTPKFTRLFTDESQLRRELGRLYVTNVGSPPPDTISAFPDAKLTEPEHKTLTDVVRLAHEWATLNELPYEITDSLSRLEKTPRDVKVTLSRVKIVQQKWADFARDGNTKQAYKLKQRLPMHELQHELRRRLWERGSKPLGDILTAPTNKPEEEFQ